MILDSTFLVDFERELRQGALGPATRFLETHPDLRLAITFTIAGELAAGETLGGSRARWEEFIRPFHLYEYSAEIGWRFGAVFRSLKAAGSLIGANDMWIAATALAHDQPLLTRNARDFARVPGLQVESY